MKDIRQEKVDAIIQFTYKFYKQGFLYSLKDNLKTSQLNEIKNYLRYELFPFLYHTQSGSRFLITSGKEKANIDLIIYGVLLNMSYLGEVDPREVSSELMLSYDVLEELNANPGELFNTIMPLLNTYQKEFLTLNLNQRMQNN